MDLSNDESEPMSLMDIAKNLASGVITPAWAVRELTRSIEVLDREKFKLPYDWFEAQKKEPESDGRNVLWANAEKATAARRREILDILKVLRQARTEIKAKERSDREARAAANKAKKIAERGPIAECQICEGHQCLTADGKMVHHGYRRPGDGQIEGDCIGVGHKPYPSLTALVPYGESLARQLQNLEMAIKGIPELTQLSDLQYKAGRFTLVTVKRDELDAYTWQRKLKTHQWKLESDLRCCQDEARRVTARIRAAGKVRS